MNGIHTGLAWLGQTTWQISVLIVLVLVVQRLFRGHLSAGWRHAMWLLVVIRMIFPFPPESALSVHNWLAFDKAGWAFRRDSAGGSSARVLPSHATDNTPSLESNRTAKNARGAGSQEIPVPVETAAAGNPSDRDFVMSRQSDVGTGWETLIAAAWLAGMGAFGLRALIQNIRFARRLRDARPVNDPAVLSPFHECCVAQRVRRPPCVIETDAVQTPALYGVLRPRFLLPVDLARELGTVQLRHVFLHELAHLARRDPLVSAVTFIAQAIHWFNPLVWIAVGRMRRDRELACDARVLRTVDESGRTAYGHTIVKLLERALQETNAPGTLGIAEGGRTIRERIRMIRHFKPGRSASWVSVALLVFVAVTGFTDGESAEAVATRTRKAHAIRGTILLPDGRPAAGAEIALCTRTHGLIVGRGRFTSQGPAPVVRSGPKGTFKITADPDAHLMVAIHPEGYAEVSLEALPPDGRISLQAFGRVEGTLVIKGKPAAGEKVSLVVLFINPELKGAYLDLTSFSALTDAEGRFKLDQVPPGEWAAYRCPEPEKTGMPFTHKTVVKVVSGETTVISIRSRGRPVMGRAVSLDSEPPIEWQTQAREFSSITTKAGFQLGRFRNLAEYQAWARTYYGSDAYKNMQRDARSYSLTFGADGSFQAEDVPPGTYELGIVLNEVTPELRRQRRVGGQLGSIQREIVVPASSGEWTDEPFDLGTVEVPLRKLLKPGQAAPPFDLKTITGEALRLDDLRGKYVLLDFWATWCGPCVAEQPDLQATWDAFGSNPRFAMVGLSLDHELEPLEEFIREHDVPWTQAWLGEWKDTQLPDEYGVYGIPSILLIDPEGRVVAKDLRGVDIKAAVAQALSAK